VNKDME